MDVSAIVIIALAIMLAQIVNEALIKPRFGQSQTQAQAASTVPSTAPSTGNAILDYVRANYPGAA